MEVHIFLCDTYATYCTYKMSILWPGTLLRYMLEKKTQESLSVVMENSFISKNVWTPRKNSYCSTQNPLLMHEFPLHGLKVGAWYAMSNLGLLGLLLVPELINSQWYIYIFCHHLLNKCSITRKPLPFFFSKIL